MRPTRRPAEVVTTKGNGYDLRPVLVGRGVILIETTSKPPVAQRAGGIHNTQSFTSQPVLAGIDFLASYNGQFFEIGCVIVNDDKFGS